MTYIIAVRATQRPLTGPFCGVIVDLGGPDSRRGVSRELPGAAIVQGAGMGRYIKQMAACALWLLPTLLPAQSLRLRLLVQEVDDPGALLTPADQKRQLAQALDRELAANQGLTVLSPADAPTKALLQQIPRDGTTFQPAEGPNPIFDAADAVLFPRVRFNGTETEFVLLLIRRDLTRRTVASSLSRGDNGITFDAKALALVLDPNRAPDKRQEAGTEKMPVAPRNITLSRPVFPALWRSALVPGWGQMYNEEGWKGGLIVLGTLALLSAASAEQRAWGMASRGYTSSSREMYYFGQTLPKDTLTTWYLYSRTLAFKDKAAQHSSRYAAITGALGVLYAFNLFDACLFVGVNQSSAGILIRF